MCTCIHRRRITAVQLLLDLSDDEIIEKWVAHDHDCEIYSDGCCGCEPRIILLTVAGEVAIDEYGAICSERMH